MGNEKSQVLEKGQQGAAEPSPTKESKGERNTDSLLDVFTSEELVETTASKLSKDLSDMSIYSLLEETKQVAQGIRGLRF
ncbi:MAG TPA: hypothetical protein VMW64_04940 [Dehalococcoidia bacterium]|nr:hypothetical protein [Dehalococcoidia bacterium]